MDQVLHKVDFLNLPKDKQREYLEHWRKIYPNKKITEGMGVSLQTMYNIMDNLGVSRTQRKKQTRKTEVQKDDRKVPTPSVPEMSTEELKEVFNPPAPIYEQPKQRMVPNGLSLNYNGIFDPKQIQSKLQKISSLIDGEENEFEVEIRIVEVEKTKRSQYKIEKLERQVAELHKALDLANEKIEAQQQAPDPEPETEEETLSKYEKGYQALKNDITGKHDPGSEYTTPYEKTPGIEIKNGKPRYQLFYHCPGCNHKGKRFVPYGSVYTNCTECGKRMNIRDAHKDGPPNRDAFSNYYIAGKFKREDEMKKEKPLYEAFGAHK